MNFAPEIKEMRKIMYAFGPPSGQGRNGKRAVIQILAFSERAMDRRAFTDVLLRAHGSFVFTYGREGVESEIACFEFSGFDKNRFLYIERTVFFSAAVAGYTGEILVASKK